MRDPDAPVTFAPEDPREVVEVPLRDGSRVWVRPIRNEDRPRLEQGLAWLSPRSRYMRFHSHVQRLTSSQLDYLVDVDHHDHEALVAIDPDAEGQPGVGVARYIRVADDPTVAEAAVTVVDAYQGRGIGTALIGLLEPLARDAGIRTFRNYVLAENAAMLRIFAELGGTCVREDDSLYRVDVPIPEDPSMQPDSPSGRWVTEVGRARPPQQTVWAYPVGWLLRRLKDEVVESSPLRLLRSLAGEEDGEADVPPDGQSSVTDSS